MKFERSTLRTVIAALVFLIAGILLLVLGSNIQKPSWAPALSIQTGSFIIASVVMALIFEFWQLRGLLEDLYQKTRIVEQLHRAQISGFSVSFHDNVPWEEMFSESNRLNMMVAYASTWRNTNQTRLEIFVARDGAELEVVLPNPGNSSILQELGTRFGSTPDEVRQKIVAAKDFFEMIGQKAQGIVRIFYIDRAPHFTFYRFNNRAVYASYRHRPGRGTIMTLIATRGGELYEWIRDEWYGIRRDGLDSGMTQVVYESKPTVKP